MAENWCITKNLSTDAKVATEKKIYPETVTMHVHALTNSYEMSKTDKLDWHDISTCIVSFILRVFHRK